MKLAVRLAILSVVAILAAAACSGSSSSGGCSVDTDCSTGTICLNGACEVQGCTGAAQCYTGQTCVDVDGDGAKECTAIDCTTDADCAAKGANYYCKLGACLPKQDILTDVYQDIQKPDGEGPEAEVAEDTTTPTEGAVCKLCENDGDCGTSVCSTLPEGDYCLPKCTSNAECPSGFLCLELTTAGYKQCVPGLYNKCADCLVTPCGAGQYCDQVAGSCKAVKAQCAACVQDDECGQGSRCLKLASGEKTCVPECGAGDTCPEKSSCTTVDSQHGTEGVKACAPQGSACCFGAQCQTVDCSAEPVNKYVSPLGTCVQCLQDSHCPLDMPKCTNYACSSPSCAAPTPIACAQGCCECTNNSHCTDAAKPTCDVGTGTCVAGTGDCGCVDPYPGCITVEGQVMCVECTEDSQCDSGCTCDTAQYICTSTGGGYCNQGTAGCTGNCQTTGCVDSTGQYPNLACDANSGCCYDASGGCDNTTAYCVQPNQECKSIMDVFGGGMGGIPGMPGGTMPGLGFCNCTGDLQAQMACLMGGLGGGLIPVDPNTICCPSPMVCMDAGQVLGLLGGSGGLPLDISLCVDPTKLMSLISP
jgi:hypothetical protein